MDDGPRYDLGGSFPVPDVAAGSALLVEGPATGRRTELLYRGLASSGSSREGILVLSGSRTAAEVRGTYRAVVGDEGLGRLAAVDCVTERLSDHQPAEAPRLRYVQSPRDLTGVSMAYDDLSAHLREAFDLAGVRVGVDALVPFVEYADVDEVYEFLHELTVKARTRGHLLLVGVDAAALDDQDARRLRTLFDGEFRLRRREDGGEAAEETGDAWTVEAVSFGPTT